MPKTTTNEKESTDLKGTVEKTIKQYSSISKENGPTAIASSSSSLSQLYKELKESASAVSSGVTDSTFSSTANINNDVERLRLTRQYFKKYSEENRKKVVNDLEAERQKKLEEVQKLDNMINLGKEVLNNIGYERKATEDSMLQTLNHFRTFCKQIGMTPAAQATEETDEMETSKNSIVLDLTN